jgi:hypothetical protein
MFRHARAFALAEQSAARRPIRDCSGHLGLQRTLTEEPINQMKISEWLDKKEAEDVDVSQIVLPEDLSYDDVPDEIIFFEEINPCGILCTGNHPFSSVERFGHWYYSKGQDKKAGIHSSEMRWRLFTRDRDLAIRTAKLHIE